MIFRGFRIWGQGPTMQVAMAAAIVALVAARPAAGQMLLVPLDGRPAGRTLALALSHHMMPLAAGPLRGSLVVHGGIAEAGLAMIAAGILPLPAFSGLCSA